MPIVYDALVPEAVVAMGRRDAERLPVGKRKGCHSKSQAEINALLVALGRDGKRVVRLKSGDPLGVRPCRRGDAGAARCRHRLRGRAGRHCRACRRCRFRTAADLARRGLLAGVHHRPRPARARRCPTGRGLAISGATVAVYMGRSVAADVAARLIEAGLSRRHRRRCHRERQPARPPAASTARWPTCRRSQPRATSPAR